MNLIPLTKFCYFLALLEIRALRFRNLKEIQTLKFNKTFPGFLLSSNKLLAISTFSYNHIRYCYFLSMYSYFLQKASS